MINLKRKIKIIALGIMLLLLNACVYPEATPKFKLTFLDDNGEEIAIVYVKEGAKVEEPDTEKEGYTFIGWDQDLTNITEDMVIKAIYKKNVYKVTFMNGDEVVEVQEVEYNESAKAPIVTREGYRFQKWDVDYTEVKSDLVVNAIFSIREYYVRFADVNGNIISSQYVKYQEAAVPPTDYEVERYKFIGWDQDFSSVTEDMLIKGIYEKEEAVIRFFNGKKALFDDYIRTKGDEYTLPVPTLEGYYFVGWFLSDRSLTEYKTIAADDINDYDFYARFIEIAPHEDTKITLPKATYQFTKINYVPNGDGTYVYQPEMPASAPGTVSEYDWSTADPKVASVSIWSSITAKSAGYTILTATYKSNKNITINCIINSSVEGIKLATEEEANKREIVTVTFLGKDGEVLCEKKTIAGSNVIYPIPPTYAGYKFVGWDQNNFDIREDRTIKAYYEKGVNKYTGKSFAILGDSISTYDGYVPTGYKVFYPYPTGDVRDVNQTWWMQVVNKLGGTLLSNDSYSGSCVAGGGDSAAHNTARLKTLKQQDISPDVILIYMGTNDCGSQYITLDAFKQSYDIMLNKIKELCPESEVIICTMPIVKCHPVELTTQYNGAIIELANKHNLSFIDFTSVNLTKHLIDSVHPKYSGMTIFADKIVGELLKKQ